MPLRKNKKLLHNQYSSKTPPLDINKHKIGAWLNGGIGGPYKEQRILGRYAFEKFISNKKMLLTFFHLSFLINPEVIPGRMTMLVTLFLVLINIHNIIQTNSPKLRILFIIFIVFAVC